MPDISTASSAVATVAEKALTEAPKGSPASGESEFSKILDQSRGAQSEETKKMMQLLGMDSGGASKVQAISAEGLEINPEAIQPQQEIRTTSKAMELLQEVNRGSLQMEGFMDLATSGKTFSPAELLYLQAGIHTTAMKFELFVKAAELGTSAPKQLLQTNFA